jgi:hypothetical protein
MQTTGLPHEPAAQHGFRGGRPDSQTSCAQGCCPDIHQLDNKETTYLTAEQSLQDDASKKVRTQPPPSPAREAGASDFSRRAQTHHKGVDGATRLAPPRRETTLVCHPCWHRHGQCKAFGQDSAMPPWAVQARVLDVDLHRAPTSDMPTQHPMLQLMKSPHSARRPANGPQEPLTTPPHRGPPISGAAALASTGQSQHQPTPANMGSRRHRPKARALPTTQAP